MLVRCIGNSLSHLNTKREKLAYSRNIHQDEVWLDIGMEYKVYGVSFRDGEDIPWFLVCEHDGEYPRPHLGAFFEIINGEIPLGWVFTSVKNNAGEIALLPKNWAEDPYFLEKIYDGEEDALLYFYELSKSI